MKKIVNDDKGFADNNHDLLNPVVIQAAENKYLCLVELKNKNEELIFSLSNPRYRHVLRMHLTGLTWQEIAEWLNVTERYAYYLYKKTHDKLRNYLVDF